MELLYTPLEDPQYKLSIVSVQPNSNIVTADTNLSGQLSIGDFV